MPHASEKVIGMAFVSPDLVFPKPDQPRKYFDEEELRLLARSIKKGGQEHPAKVKVLHENGEGTTYQLIDGERRWRACAMINERLWVVICSVGSDAEHFRSASVSNIASLQLAPLEIAHAVERVKREYNMTQAEVAETFCKSAGWAAQHLGLLRLAPAVQSQLSGAIPKNGRLPFQIAVDLSPFPHDAQVQFVARMRKKGWKTKRARQELRKLGRKLDVSPEKKQRIRKPSDDHRILQSFLRRVKDDADMVLQIPEERFDEMFASRSPLERLSTLKFVQEVLETVGVVQHAIRRATRPENQLALKIV